MMKMIHLQVEAPHGSEGISQIMTLEGKGLATTGDRRAGAEEVSDFVTMTVMMMTVITWMPFFDPFLVRTNPFIGRSLMERIFNGVAHQDTLGGLGIGDIGLKKSMNLRVKVYSQI